MKQLMMTLVLGLCVAACSSSRSTDAGPNNPKDAKAFQKAVAGVKWASNCQVDQQGQPNVEILSMDGGGNGTATALIFAQANCQGGVVNQVETPFTYRWLSQEKTGSKLSLTINGQNVEVIVIFENDLMKVSANGGQEVPYRRQGN